MHERFDTVIIGGGQAGLSVSYYLSEQNHLHVILEKENWLANSWRNGRWDSFTLVTPNWTVRLPGFPYQGTEPDGFMSGKDVVRHLERYSESFHAPVRLGVQAVSVSSGEMHFLVSAANGATYEARNVVVATGSFQRPKKSTVRDALPASIAQLHSSEYRNPGAIEPGAVLVVGSADSGAQIAEELLESGRQTYLCVGDSGRVPRSYRGKDIFAWLDLMDVLDRPSDPKSPAGDRFRSNPHLSGKNGGHTINLHKLALDGMVLLGHLDGANEYKIALASDLPDNLRHADQLSDNFKKSIDGFIEETVLDVPAAEPDPVDDIRSIVRSPTTELDLQAAGISTVIWANGYSFDYSWVDLPVFDEFGFPISRRGVTDFPGLYFVGMNRLYSGKSGILFGVGDDAAHIASDILR